MWKSSSRVSQEFRVLSLDPSATTSRVVLSWLLREFYLFSWSPLFRSKLCAFCNLYNYSVAPLLHQRSIEDDIELDARERGRHFNGARPFVGRGGFGITRGGLQAREVEESLEAREPRISGAQLRTVGHHVKSGIELAAT